MDDGSERVGERWMGEEVVDTDNEAKLDEKERAWQRLRVERRVRMKQLDNLKYKSALMIRQTISDINRDREFRKLQQSESAPLLEPIYQSVQSLVGKQKAGEVKTFSGKEVVSLKSPLIEEIQKFPEEAEQLRAARMMKKGHAKLLQPGHFASEMSELEAKREKFIAARSEYSWEVSQPGCGVADNQWKKSGGVQPITPKSSSVKMMSVLNRLIKKEKFARKSQEEQVCEQEIAILALKQKSCLKNFETDALAKLQAKQLLQQQLLLASVQAGKASSNTSPQTTSMQQLLPASRKQEQIATFDHPPAKSTVSITGISPSRGSKSSVTAYPALPSGSLQFQRNNLMKKDKLSKTIGGFFHNRNFSMTAVDGFFGLTESNSLSLDDFVEEVEARKDREIIRASQSPINPEEDDDLEEDMEELEELHDMSKNSGGGRAALKNQMIELTQQDLERVMRDQFAPRQDELNPIEPDPQMKEHFENMKLRQGRLIQVKKKLGLIDVATQRHDSMAVTSSQLAELKRVKNDGKSNESEVNPFPKFKRVSQNYGKQARDKEIAKAKDQYAVQHKPRGARILPFPSPVRRTFTMITNGGDTQSHGEEKNNFQSQFPISSFSNIPDSTKNIVITEDSPSSPPEKRYRITRKTASHPQFQNMQTPQCQQDSKLAGSFQLSNGKFIQRKAGGTTASSASGQLDLLLHDGATIHSMASEEGGEEFVRVHPMLTGTSCSVNVGRRRLSLRDNNQPNQKKWRGNYEMGRGGFQDLVDQRSASSALFSLNRTEQQQQLLGTTTTNTTTFVDDLSRSVESTAEFYRDKVKVRKEFGGRVTASDKYNHASRMKLFNFFTGLVRFQTRSSAESSVVKSSLLKGFARIDTDFSKWQDDMLGKNENFEKNLAQEMLHPHKQERQFYV